MNNIKFSTRYRLFIILTLLVCCQNFSQSHIRETDILANRLNSLSENKNLDIVYIQTNKDIYETEEDLWFKGYVLDSQFFFPSSRNKTLFVQLWNNKTDVVVWEEKYEINKGFVDGHIFLRDSLQPGDYILAAYSENSFFDDSNGLKAIRKLRLVRTILNKKPSVPIKKDSSIHLSIFPEGGNLISGIENNVAFKAVSKDGNPVNVSGALYENNVPILSFSSKHAGMGSFIFTPDINKKYHIRLGPKLELEHTMPTIQLAGKTLRLVRNTDYFLTFKVSKNTETKENFYLRLQQRGVVYSVQRGILQKDLLVKIPLHDMSEGFGEVTLFDKDLRPVAERLVYIKQDQKLDIGISLNKNEFNTREKAVLKLKVTDQNKKPTRAHLGISIFDGIYKNYEDSKNILTHYHLSTQLKGKLYDPAYYFDEKNKNRRSALDLLLQTQGWRRYLWNEDNLKSNNKSPKVVAKDTIEATLFSKKRKISKELFVKAFAGNNNGQAELILTDTTGKFHISPRLLKKGEKSYLYFTPLTSSQPRNRIDIRDVGFKKINEVRQKKTMSYPLAQLEEDEPLYFQSPVHSDTIIQLEETTLTAKKKKVFRDRSIGRLDSLAKLETTDFVCNRHFDIHVLNCFQHGRMEDSTKPVDGEIYEILLGENKEELDETYSKDYFFGSIRRKYIYPEFTEAYLLEKFNMRVLKGYYGKREFYNPVYDDETISDLLPDPRNTLFWDPAVTTDENGEATISFFTSDINTSFIGNIEGVGVGGLLGRRTFEFRVQKAK